MKTSFPPLAVQLSLALLGGTITLGLTGCANTSSGSGYADVNRRSVAVVDADDYVYYPGYEVYYSNTRHRYVYRDRDRWVTRAEPPRGWVQGGVSVHMDWHDAPERHHADVSHRYPRNWHPRPRDSHDRDDHGHRDGDHDHDDRH